ncbi:MAG: pyridoxal phosphate-dependent aminotransferase [Paracoccaceae bacterium]
MAPNFTKLIASLPSSVPFVGPETQERARGRAFAARIGANENVFGASPKALAAMRDVLGEVWMYGDPENHDLRQALAGHLAIAPENIAVGEGIDALLGYLVRLLVEPGDKVVTSLGAYPTFNYHVAGFGAELICVPYKGDAEDPEALIAKAREVGAKMIYLANPDNPMGSWHDAAVVARMISQVPEGSLLVLDEAYVEFAPDGTAPALDVNDTRVIRMRTFSKAYGLAGARVGYAMAPASLIAAFNRIRNHFGMCRMSQAGAIAALADQAHLSRVLKLVAQARTRIGEIGAAHGLHALPSATNFVALDCGRDANFARAVVQGLIDRDVFVRMPFAPPQDRCIRVSAGTPENLEALRAALPGALNDARTAAG